MEKKIDLPIITVIVPIYNAEKYLEQCLNSISLQTYKNLEIILVDDGSSDLTPDICERWRVKDARFIVFHKENGGIASARNTGLALRTGKYVTWVDSDDWIDEDYIEDLYKKIIKYDADVAINCREGNFDSTEILFDNRILKHYLNGELSNVLWQTMVKSELYDNKNFVDYRIGEDADMLVRIYEDVNKIVRFKKSGYHWRVHANSTTRSLDYEKVASWYQAKHNQFLEIEKKHPELKPYCSYQKIYMGSMLYRNVITMDKNNETVQLKKELRKMILRNMRYLAFGELTRVQTREVLGAIKTVLFK